MVYNLQSYLEYSLQYRKTKSIDYSLLFQSYQNASILNNIKYSYTHYRSHHTLTDKISTLFNQLTKESNTLLEGREIQITKSTLQRR